MQKSREYELLKRLAEREDLAEKKAKIYSRLLTEVTLAEDMETLAVRAAERKKSLKTMLEKLGGEEK